LPMSPGVVAGGKAIDVRFAKFKECICHVRYGQGKGQKDRVQGLGDWAKLFRGGARETGANQSEVKRASH